MRVGIIGAGIAGLAAGRELKKNGHEVVIFEKSNVVGGRCTTEHVGGYTFDTGATSIAPRGRILETVMLNQLDTLDIQKVTAPIFVHAFGHITAGSQQNHLTRYVYKEGVIQLPKLLAAELDTRLETSIESIEKSFGDCYKVADEIFEALILTAPIPETTELLKTLNEIRPLANCRYRSCLSVLLAFDKPFVDHRYHAIVDPEQRNPLTWLSIETNKCPGRAPDGHTVMVAQMGPYYSAANYESSDEEIIRETLNHIERLYKKDFSSPVVSKVKRWKYSQPETTALFEFVNRPGARLLIASDGIIGARIEFAFEAGYLAATRLIESN